MGPAASASPLAVICMRTLQTSIIIILFLTRCSNNIDVVKDTTTRDSTANLVQSRDSNDLFNNPLRNLNNFELTLHSNEIHSLNKDFINNKKIKTEIKNDLCAGDCCTSFKIMTDIDPSMNSVQMHG